MKRIALVVALLLPFVSTSPTFAAAKAGATCSKLGATSTVSGKKFTCIKSGKKLVWDKGVVQKITNTVNTELPKVDTNSTTTTQPEKSKSIYPNELDKCKNGDPWVVGTTFTRKYVYLSCGPDNLLHPQTNAPEIDQNTKLPLPSIPKLDPSFAVQGQACIPKSGDVIGYNKYGEFVDLMCNEFDNTYFPRPANLNPFKVDPKTGKRLKGEMQNTYQSIEWADPKEIKSEYTTSITPTGDLGNLNFCKIKDAAADGQTLSNPQKHFVSGFGLYPERAPLTREPIIQFVTIDFPDLPGKRTPTEDLKPVTDFLGKYWSSQTSSGIKLNFQIPDSYIRMPKNVVDYELNVDFFSGKWKNTTSFDYVREAIKIADSKINFSNVDVMVIAVPAEVTRQQIAAFVAESSEAARGQGFRTDEKWIYNTLIMAGPVGSQDFELLNWAHELGHNFGLTDIRNTLNVAAQDSSDLGVYDLMNSMLAPELLAWNRFIIGILDDNQVRCVTTGSSTHLIKPVEMNSKEAKLIVIPTGTYKAIAIESRRAIGFDATLGSLSEGVIVYQIDTTIPYNLSPMKLVPRVGSTDSVWRRDSALKVGDSLNVNGWKISVVESGNWGDVVKVEKVG